MRFLRYLTEEYHTSLKIFGEQVPIFVNPSRKELQEIVKHHAANVRYIIDCKENLLYAWTAYSLTHYDVQHKVPNIPKINCLLVEAVFDSISGKLIDNIALGYESKDYDVGKWVKLNKKFLMKFIDNYQDFVQHMEIKQIGKFYYLKFENNKRNN